MSGTAETIRQAEPDQMLAETHAPVLQPGRMALEDLRLLRQARLLAGTPRR